MSRTHCHTCGTSVPNPTGLHIIWTYALGGDATYCTTHAWDIRDPFGDRFLPTT